MTLRAEQPAALPTRRLFFYGLAEMPLQIAAIPVAALVPHYYGADLGVSLAAIGTILLVSKIFDAVSDPAVGWLSDHTNSRLGRRRVWMVAAVPIHDALGLQSLYARATGGRVLHAWLAAGVVAWLDHAVHPLLRLERGAVPRLL